MIRSNGQIIGSIIIQSKDPESKVGEFEKRVAMVACRVFGQTNYDLNYLSQEDSHLF